MLSKRTKMFIVSSLGVIALVLIALALLFFVRPSSSPKDRQAPENPAGFELLGYIPSDACGVQCFENVLVGLEFTSIPCENLIELPFGELSRCKAVLSLHFVGKLVPMLSLEIPRINSRTEEALGELQRACAQQDLHIKIYRESSAGPAFASAVVQICSSESIIGSAATHLDAGSSVLDAPGIRDYLFSVKRAGAELTLFRNQALPYLLKYNFLSRYLKPDQTLRFLKKYADWTVLRLLESRNSGAGEYLRYEVSCIRPADDPAKGGAFLSELPAFNSELDRVLPYGTTFALDLPLDGPESYVEARKLYMDARGELNGYLSLLNARGAGTETAFEWFKAFKPAEIARISFRSKYDLILLRTNQAQKVPSALVSPNACQGFCAAVFGPAFRLKDDSFCAWKNSRWLAIGSEESVRAFLRSELNQKVFAYPQGASSAILIADGLNYSQTPKGSFLWVYKKF